MVVLVLDTLVVMTNIDARTTCKEYVQKCMALGEMTWANMHSRVACAQSKQRHEETRQ